MVLNEKDKKKICRSYKDGKSVEAIANKYGVSKQRIYVILHENGIRSTESILSEKDEEMVCRAYKDGKSVEILAKTYRISKDQIYVTLRKNGIRSVKSSKKKQDGRKAVAKTKVEEPKTIEPETVIQTSEQKTILTSIMIADGNVQTITTTDKAYASEIDLRWMAVPNMRSHAFGDPNGKSYTVVYYVNDKPSNDHTADEMNFERNIDVMGVDEDHGFYVKVAIPKDKVKSVSDAVIGGRAKARIVLE